ncbi:MAG TPA: NAD(P)/FAD-dependent oxidoreductase [Actinokineospora sp.]|nr:NAD(P)/FAD-dependent oxidoreductase [Actinokineospora sp.]
MKDTKTALVIGGGIAGPVTAMALRRAGIDAVVHEGHDGPADGVGGMLGLAPNGFAALSQVGVGGLGEPVTSMVMRSWTGKRLAEFADPAGTPILHAVWRSDLYATLRAEAGRQGVKIEYGKRLVRVDDIDDQVTAYFADGSTATADILVGADGIRSTVRGLITDVTPRYTGLLGFGGRPVRVPGLDTPDRTMNMLYGKHAFFGHGTFADGRTGWYANLPRRSPIPLAEAAALGPAHWLDVIRAEFAADRTAAPRVLAHARPDDLVIVGALEDLPTVPVWSRGRVVLVGDAAHATSPSSGQGASLAAESAVELARCLRDLPHADAFAAYERLRRPRVERVIAAGARASSAKAAGPLASVVRDLTMPLAMRLLARPGKLAWQYDHRIDWDAPVHSGPR